MKSGLAPETISQILRRGKTNTPRPDTLRMLADALGGSFEYMMQLAGHLPPPPRRELSMEQQARVDHIMHIWREVAELDPKSLGELLNVVESQAEMAKALLDVGRRLEQNEEENHRHNG